MDCLACGHDNRALAKFCEECGVPFAQGRAADARRAYGEAFRVIEAVAAGLTDENLRETLRNSDRVQEIRRAADAR